MLHCHDIFTVIIIKWFFVIIIVCDPLWEKVSKLKCMFTEKWMDMGSFSQIRFLPVWAGSKLCWERNLYYYGVSQGLSVWEKRIRKDKLSFFFGYYFTWPLFKLLNGHLWTFSLIVLGLIGINLAYLSQ